MTASSRQVAVWLDHHEAKIFHLGETGMDASAVHAPGRHLHRHPTHTRDRTHPADVDHFFDEVLGALEGAQQILVVGPGSAKLELIKYVHAHKPKLEPAIIGVETVDHPTDGQLAAHARRYFSGES